MTKPSFHRAQLLTGVALLVLAVVLFAWVPFQPGFGEYVPALTFVAGCALISWGVAPSTGRGHWAAAGTAIAALWAFAVAFSQYFSTCRWVSWLDLAVVFTGSVLALARIYRIRLGLVLLRFALPLVLALAISHVCGLLARGFLDDPRM